MHFQDAVILARVILDKGHLTVFRCIFIYTGEDSLYRHGHFEKEESYSTRD